MATGKLYGLHFCKLLNQGFINDKVLFAVLSRRLVLMFTDTLFQERLPSKAGIPTTGATI